MTRSRASLGRRGEAIVAARLAAAGWHIVATNWRCPEGEIDVVARDGACLVIVEVRTRASTRMGTPEESVGPAKRVRLARLANRYAYETGWSGAYRIDVFAVTLSADGTPRVIHHRNAVSGDWA